MFKLLHVLLSLSASIAVTALVMVVVFPVHARSSATEPAGGADIVPAVLVEVTGTASGGASPKAECPALSQLTAGSSCPYLAGKMARAGADPHAEGDGNTAASACPYLARQAAGTGCPALTERTGDAVCPYLAGRDRSATDVEGFDGGEAPNTLDL